MDYSLDSRSSIVNMNNSKRGTTITNYLVTGDPEGIIFSYMSNWTGQAVKIPRNLFAEARIFDEINKPGIYFLIGQSESNPDDKLIYVGEANNLSERITTHLRDQEKSFFEVIVCFSSKDENLTVSHTKYLEDRIISNLGSSRDYTMKNGKSGNTISLPRMVRDEMDTYYDNMKIILPTLGYNILNDEQMSAIKREEVSDELYLDISNFKARARLTSNGLLVLKGSSMNMKETPSLSGSYSNLRKTIQEKGIVTSKGQILEFAQDYEFPSPSTAAAIILGYSINGRTAWKDKKGKTLKEKEEERLKTIIV